MKELLKGRHQAPLTACKICFPPTGYFGEAMGEGAFFSGFALSSGKNNLLWFSFIHVILTVGI